METASAAAYGPSASPPAPIIRPTALKTPTAQLPRHALPASLDACLVIGLRVPEIAVQPDDLAIPVSILHTLLLFERSWPEFRIVSSEREIAQALNTALLRCLPVLTQHFLPIDWQVASLREDVLYGQRRRRHLLLADVLQTLQDMPDQWSAPRHRAMHQSLGELGGPR